jgi:hypothetical protein
MYYYFLKIVLCLVAYFFTVFFCFLLDISVARHSFKCLFYLYKKRKNTSCALCLFVGPPTSRSRASAGSQAPPGRTRSSPPPARKLYAYRMHPRTVHTNVRANHRTRSWSGARESRANRRMRMASNCHPMSAYRRCRCFVHVAAD